MKGLTLRLILIFLIISVLAFLSLISMGAIDEGTQGEGISGLVALFLSKLFFVFRFPTHTLFFERFSSGHLFFIGLGINILFWTTIIHMTTRYLKK